MKKTSRIGSFLRVLTLTAIAAAGLSLWDSSAWADACFGGGGGGDPVLRDADGTGNDAGDGSTLGLLRSPKRTNWTVGVGLVLVAGLGGAWLGWRKQDGDADRNGDA